MSWSIAWPHDLSPLRALILSLFSWLLVKFKMYIMFIGTIYAINSESRDAPAIQRSSVRSQNSINGTVVLWYRPSWRSRLGENAVIRWIRLYFSSGARGVNILPRLGSYSSSQAPLSALECDGGWIICIDNSNLWIAARGRSIICPLTLCQRKITQ